MMNSAVRYLYTHLTPFRVRSKLERLIVGAYPKVFDEKQFIFIHIPKTAGKSVGKLIGVRGACHLTLAEYEHLLGREKINSYYIFTVLRDPAKRFISAWTYITSGGNFSREDLTLKQKILSQSVEINDFAVNHLKKIDFISTRLFRPQASYLKWSSGEVSQTVTTFHLGQLATDIFKLPKHIINSRTLPHINQSKKGQNDPLTEEAVSALLDIYKEDYQLLRDPSKPTYRYTEG